jgi:SAM-dependent methyltransferase
MGIEIDLLENYPKTKRDLKQRANEKTQEDRNIARKFGQDFFDGDRKHGYGGFNYISRFWQPVIPTFIKHFNLNENSKVLDVGCAKGFMLFDMKEAIPNITIEGIDISSYAIENAKEEIKQFLRVGNAKELPYEDNSFDVVISINTIHNLEKKECAKALQEIQRVSRKRSYVCLESDC